MLRVLKNRLRDSHELPDVLQNVLIILLQRVRRAPLNDASRLQNYVVRTAMFCAIAHLRDMRELYDRNLPLDAERLRVAEDSADPVQAVSHDRLASIVLDLLDGLPVARDREILHRYYLREEPKALICDALSLGPRHFDRVLHRARKRLQERVDSRDCQNFSAFTA